MRTSLWSRPWVMPLVALSLFAATVASRLPFTSRVLYAWDSANFALALQRYNVAFEQPHAPGYPLYVGIAYLVNLLLRDANASLVAISIVASATAVAVLFLLASRLFDPWTGLISALLLGTSVGFWGYGEVAYPYPALAGFGTLIAWLCCLMWQGHRWVAVLSGLVLGLAAGVRTDLLLFLAPLWLVGLWHSGLRRALLSVLVLGLTVGSWLLPAVQLSGGWAAYEMAGSAQSSYVLWTYSFLYAGLEGVRRNTETLLLFLKQMFGLSLLVTVYFLGRFLTFKALVTDWCLVFLLLWILPAVLFYALIHIGDPGYVLSILPPLCVVTAAGLRDIALDLRSALILLLSRLPRGGALAEPGTRLRGYEKGILAIPQATPGAPGSAAVSAAEGGPVARAPGRPWTRLWTVAPTPRGLTNSSLAAGAGTALVVVMVLGLIAWNVNAFLLTPGPARLPEIRAIDTLVASQVEYTRTLPPGSTVVLAKAHFRQFKYYLAEYDLRLLYDEYQLGYLEGQNSYRIPEGVTTVLVMDFGKPPVQFPGARGGEVVLSDGPGQFVDLWRFDVRPGDTIQYGYDHFAISN